MARDTKLGQEEITRDIPNVGEEALKNLDEAGIVYIGAEVKPGDILVGKVTPKGESPMTPEEKLLRAIFGEKASDVRDTSLRLPPGVSGTIVEVRVFSRRGVDKDERALAIERAEIERLAKDRDDETRDPRAQLLRPPARSCCSDQIAVGGPKGMKAGDRSHREGAGRVHPGPVAPDHGHERQAHGRHRGAEEAVRRDASSALEQRFENKVEKLQRGDELPPGVMKMVKVFVAVKRKLQPGDKMAGRHGNKGVISHDRADRGHAVSRGRHAGRHRAEPAGRAEPHECRPDPGDPSRLGLRRSRPPDRRDARQGRAAAAARRRSCASCCGDDLWREGRTSRDRRTSTTTQLLELARQPARRRADGDRRSSTARARTTSSRCWSRPGSHRSGQVTLIDGRTGEAFDRKVTVGYIYMLKLHHLVDDKIHARSIGPYSLVTQQPLGGKAQFGGQRFGEMEVWALEAYGAAYTLQEMLTVKSDDVSGRTKVYEAIVRGDDNFEAGIPEILQRAGQGAALARPQCRAGAAQLLTVERHVSRTHGSPGTGSSGDREEHA